METAIVLARIAQYLGGAVLFGTPLFLIRASPPAASPPDAEPRWIRPLGVVAGGGLLLAALAYLLAQTANMAGDAAAAGDPNMLWGVLTDSAMGWAIMARGAAAAVALIIALAAPSGRALSAVLGGLGLVALLSFAWTGHGAADEGARGLVHLVADLLHLLAASLWVGALVGFALLLRWFGGPARSDAGALHGALAGFSGVGSAIVAVIIATGLVNSWFLVGPEGVRSLFVTPYGLVLAAKLVLFAGMLLLAAQNRFRHTPALASAIAFGDPKPLLGRLKTSVLLETALGFAVLALVGVLGMLSPVASD
jgi:putative copper resistance protein D